MTAIKKWQQVIKKHDERQDAIFREQDAFRKLVEKNVNDLREWIKSEEYAVAKQLLCKTRQAIKCGNIYLYGKYWVLTEKGLSVGGQVEEEGIEKIVAIYMRSEEHNGNIVDWIRGGINNIAFWERHQWLGNVIEFFRGLTNGIFRQGE